MNLKELASKAKGSSILNEVVEIKLSNISKDPNQPRKFFDPDKLQELVEDIKLHNLLQPILVREDQEKDGEKHFVIVLGERRFKAFEELGKETIPAIVLKKDMLPSDDQLAYLQMAENIKRDNLKYYEIAEFIVQRSFAGETQEAIAQRLGMHRSMVAFYSCWKDAPNWLKDAKKFFRSIRTFYSFYQESKVHPEELKAFLNLVTKIREDNKTFDDEKFLLSTGLLQHGAYKKYVADIKPSKSLEDQEGLQTKLDVAQTDDEGTDTKGNNSDVELMSNPKILGYDSDSEREVKLLFTKKPPKDGFVWVEYLDSCNEEVILSSSFKISRIIECDE